MNQSAVDVMLCFYLVVELITITRLIIDLLEHTIPATRHRGTGIAALSMPEESNDGIPAAAYGFHRS